MCDISGLNKVRDALTNAERVVELAGGLGSYDAHVKGGGFNSNVDNVIKEACNITESIEKALVALDTLIESKQSIIDKLREPESVEKVAWAISNDRPHKGMPDAADYSEAKAAINAIETIINT